MFKRIAVLVFVLVGLGGYPETPMQVSAVTQTDVHALQKENRQLKEKWEVLQRRQAEERDVFRETLNVSYRLFRAVQSNDYAYLEQATSSRIHVDRKENEFIYDPWMEAIPFSVIPDPSGAIDYRFHHLEDGRMTIGFAHYVEESSVVVQLDFVQENERWVLEYVLINK